MNSIVCETDWLRDVIKGVIAFRKCPHCDGDGKEIQCYDADGNPCFPDHKEATRHTCEVCDGLAFIEIPS